MTHEGCGGGQPGGRQNLSVADIDQANRSRSVISGALALLGEFRGAARRTKHLGLVRAAFEIARDLVGCLARQFVLGLLWKGRKHKVYDCLSLIKDR